MIKKTSQVIAFATLTSAIAQVNASVVHKGPEFYGKLSIGALNVQGRDVAPWAFAAEAGVDGLFIVTDGLKIKYVLSAELSNAINDNDDLAWSMGNVDGDNDNEAYIRNAKIVAITDYGSFIFAPRTASAQWAQMYGNIDTFQYNRFHSQTGDIAIFGQPEQTEDLIAYATPRMGGIQFGTSMIATNDQNGNDLDVWTNRLTYAAGPLYLAASHTIVDSRGLPTADDYKRTAINGGYDFGSIKLAGVYEIDRDHPTGDWNSYGINFSVSVNDNWTVKAAYVDKDHDNNNFDLSGAVFGIDRHFGEDVKFFIETGLYDEAQDNLALGFALTL